MIRLQRLLYCLLNPSQTPLRAFYFAQVPRLFGKSNTLKIRFSVQTGLKTENKFSSCEEFALRWAIKEQMCVFVLVY